MPSSRPIRKVRQNSADTYNLLTIPTAVSEMGEHVNHWLIAGIMRLEETAGNDPFAAGSWFATHST